MNAVQVADIRDKSVTNAKRQFVELYGSALVWNTYLKLVVLLLVLLASGLVVVHLRDQERHASTLPIIIRIDNAGRAEAVQYDPNQYRPEAAELRYFLTQFVVRHFSRIRSRIHRDYPESLLFLGPEVGRQPQDIEAFVSNPSQEEVEIVVQNVSLVAFQTPPYKAAITFQKVFLTPGARQERGRETFVAQVEFDRLTTVPNQLVTVNPLGFQIHYLHPDQAFEEARP